MFIPSFVPPSLFPVGTRVAGYFPGGKEARGVRLTSYLHLVPMCSYISVTLSPNIHMYMLPTTNSMKQSPSWEVNSFSVS
jgi:hypothetical protein